MSMKAIGYVRVSTDEQHLGADVQRLDIAAYAKAKGWELASIHVDHGVSGATPLDDRPGLWSAVQALGKGDVLIVTRRDRLARDIVVAAMVDRFVAKAGASLVSCAGEGNEGGPTGELMRTLVDAFAQYERALIRSRTRAALGVKRARNERTGSIPVGHVETDGHLEATPAVARARELRAAGESYASIGDTLTVEGHAPQGKAWHITSVRRMLTRVSA
jgi:DNA invertase Pin-like site-specific DNA recombinase